MESVKKWLSERNARKNGLYVHYSPPRPIGLVSSAQLRQLVRDGTQSRVERAVLAGQGRRLLAESEALSYSHQLPALIDKCEKLHAAVEKGSLLELQELLESDYNRRKYVNCRDEAGVGLLHKAVYYDFMDIAEYLVHNYPQLVHAKDSEGRTPLHYAALCRDAAAAASLLEGAGAARGARDASGRTPAHYRGEARTLLTLPAPTTHMPKENAKSPPGLVIKRHNIRIWCHDCDMARLQRVVWEGHGNRLLSEVSNQHIVKRFLEAVPYIMNTIKDIHTAVVENDLEGVMKHAGDPVPPQALSSRDANFATVMHKAAGLGHSSILKFIAERYPQGVNDIDNEGRTPLHYAAAVRDDQHVYNTLVDLGADESILDNKNKTPAYYINRPQEIDKHLLKTIPDAPRTPSNAYPHSWDWKLLDNHVITELHKKSRRKNFKASNENISSKNYTNTISESTDNHTGAMKASSTHEFISDLPELDDGNKHIEENEPEEHVEQEEQHEEIKEETQETELTEEQDNADETNNEENGGDENAADIEKDAEENPEHPTNDEEAATTNETEEQVDATENHDDDTEGNVGETKENVDENGENDGETEGNVETSQDNQENAIENAEQETDVNDENIDNTEQDTNENDDEPINNNDDINGEEKQANVQPVDNEVEESEENNKEDANNEETNNENDEQKSRAISRSSMPSADNDDKVDGDPVTDDKINGHQEEETHNNEEDTEQDENKSVSRPQSTKVNNNHDGENENGKILTEEGEHNSSHIEGNVIDNENSEDDDDVQVPGDTHSEYSELNQKSTAELPNNGSATIGSVSNGRNTQESLIEGIINGEAEQDSQDASITQRNGSVQGEVLVVDSEIDPEVTDLINTANMEMLATLVLNGEGSKLIGRRSRNSELQGFLDNVPTYMQKINKVHVAARDGNIKDLQSALDRRKFAIARDPISPNGATPLHVATVFGKSNIMKYLGGRFPETLSAVDFEGRTALHYAATLPDNGHYYNLLQQLGANSKDLDDNGKSAEDYFKNPSLLPFDQLLSDFGINEDTIKSMFADKGPAHDNEHMDIPIFRTDEGRYLAQSLGDPVIKGLTEVANVKPKDPVAFLASFLHNFPEHEKPRIDTQETNVLVAEEAAEMENEQAPAAIESQAVPKPPRSGTRTAIRSHRPIDVVTVDPQPVISPDAPETAFSSAKRDEHGQSMLHFAAARTHARNALFQLLQESDVSLGYRDELYRTARDVSTQANVPENTVEIDKWVLHLAARGNTEKIQELLMEGYDHILDVVDEEGVSITDIVAQRGDTEMQNLLSSIPAFEESRDALHSAVRRGDLAAVKNLLDAEKDRNLVRSQNSFSRTALHIAVLAQHEEIVAYLAQTYPELLRIGDNLERTPLHYAMGVEKIESLSRVLIRAGAKRVLKDLKGRQPTYYFMNKSDILRLQEEEEIY